MIYQYLQLYQLLFLISSGYIRVRIYAFHNFKIFQNVVMGIYHVGVVLRTIRNLRQIFQCWFEPRENCIVITTHKASIQMIRIYVEC